MAIYRLILELPATGDSSDQWRFATGATYSGCERITNPSACDPAGFSTLQAAIDYAVAHNEIPVRVITLDQIDGILSGAIPVTDSMILSTGGGFFDNLSTPVLIGGAALVLIMLSQRKRKS